MFGKVAVLSLNLSTWSIFTTNYFLTLCRTAFFFYLVLVVKHITVECSYYPHYRIIQPRRDEVHFFQYWLEFPGRGSVWTNVMQLPSSGPTYCSQGWSNRWAQHGASPKDKHFQKDDCSEIPTVTYISHCGYDEYIKRRSYLALSFFFFFFFLVTHVFLLVRHF